MQLVVAQFLDAGSVRRSTEVFTKLPYRANVLGLRLLAELAHPHVFDHALAQRTDGLPGFHGLLLSEIEAELLVSNIGSFLPLQTSYFPEHPATVKHHPYRANGLVPGRVARVGRLAAFRVEPTAE